MENIHPAHDHQPPTGPENARTFTLRVPKPNWQVTALILIAVIAAFQSWQLGRLKGTVTAEAASPSTAAATTAPAAGNSGLQSQVGGC